MSKRQELEAQIARTQDDDAKDAHNTLKALQAFRGRKMTEFANLAVSWKENGKVQKIELKGDIDPKSFHEAVAGIPQAVQRAVASRQPSPGLSPFHIRSAFRKRHVERQTHIYRLGEQLKQITGSSDVPVLPAPDFAELHEDDEAKGEEEVF